MEVSRGTILAGEFYATEGELIRLTLGNFDYQRGGFKHNTSKDNIYFSGKVKEEYILNEGDIITPLTEQTAGLLGSTARIPESGKYIQSQDVALIRCNEALLDPTFCYYLLPSASVKKQLGAAAQQTKIRHTTPDRIKEVIVDIPPLAEQKAIGKILDAITSKIELNYSINHYLDDLVRQLYDYWFVQFDFPDENGKPYKSSGGEMVWDNLLHKYIPVEWGHVSLSEIMVYSGGSQPPASEFLYYPKEGYTRFVQIRDYYTDAHLTYIPNSSRNKICNERDIMIARYGASLGRICYGLNGAYNVALAKISPLKDYYREYLRAYLSSDTFYKKINVVGGRAAQAGFNREDIDNIDICFPDNDNIIFKFEKLVSVLFEQKLRNDKEIRLLTSERDNLISLLMTGQVSLKQLNNDLPVSFIIIRKTSQYEE